MRDSQVMFRRFHIIVAIAILAGCTTACVAGSADKDPGQEMRKLTALFGEEALAADEIPRPSECRSISEADELRRLALGDSDPANSPTTICLTTGEYVGPFELGRDTTVWGPKDAVIVSNGQGTTVRLTGDHSSLLNLTVSGSGTRYDLQDAAVHVGADDTRIAGLVIRDAMFGLIVEKANRVTVRGNRVHGTQEAALGLRGDSVRFWETRDSLIENNVITHSRDIVVWYSERNIIQGNIVSGSRYGTHFMYSHGNKVRDNSYVGNVVGIFAMYSRNLVLERNLLADAHGAAGMGLGLKESGNLQIVDNNFIRNHTGVFVDNSPFVETDHNTFQGNVIRLSDTGVVFHSSPKRNNFYANSLRDNVNQVRVDGGGDATGMTWRRNDFDDYVGYDFNDDGIGDVPYELRRLSSQLAGRNEELQFFHGTFALKILNAVGHILPLYAPKTILIDPEPAMLAVSVEERFAH